MCYWCQWTERLIIFSMIPYMIWLWFKWGYSALKCGARSNFKSCKMTQYWKSLFFFFPWWWVSFSAVSFVFMHLNININKESNTPLHKQTNNKQTCMGISNHDSNHVISQNHRYINHNKTSKMKKQGLDLNRLSSLLSLRSLISSINMVRAQ